MIDAIDVLVTTVSSVRPALAVAIPATVAAILLFVRTTRLSRLLATTTALVTVVLVLSMTFTVRAGRIPQSSGREIAPGIRLVLRADPLGLVFALTLATIVAIGLPMVATGTKSRKTDSSGRVTAALVGALAAAMAVAFADNLLVLVIALELLTIVTYPLVSHSETDCARWAGYRYLAYTLTGGVLALAGVRLVYTAVGTVSFVPGGIEGVAAAEPTLVGIAFILLLLGFGVKAAVVPLHGWVLGARAAPGPAYAIAFPVIVISAGAFAILRTVLDGFGPILVGELGIAWIGIALAGITILVGNLLALATSDLERRLSYAAIAGAGGTLLGVFVLAPVAITGAIVHLVSQAIGIGIALLALTHVVQQTGSATTSKLRGSGRLYPAAGIAFGVGVASLVGLPLSVGFLAIWYLLVGAGTVGHIVAGTLLVVSAVFHVVYLLPPLLSMMRLHAYDSDHRPDHGPTRSDGGYAFGTSEGRRARPLLVGAAVLLLLGSFPDQTIVLELAWLAVETSTGVGTP